MSSIWGGDNFPPAVSEADGSSTYELQMVCKRTWLAGVYLTCTLDITFCAMSRKKARDWQRLNSHQDEISDSEMWQCRVKQLANQEDLPGSCEMGM